MNAPMEVYPDFGNYDLRNMPENGVFGLSDDLLKDMAEGFGYEGFQHLEQPTEASLREFVGVAGKAKTLQDNIARTEEQLGVRGNANEMAIGWVKRAGIMVPMDRSFVHPEVSTPKQLDMALITGGVARWVLRRADRLIALKESGVDIGRVVLAAGKRDMGAAEHDLVAGWPFRGTPTEQNFMRKIVADKLEVAGIAADVLAIDSQKGDEVMAEVVDRTGLTGKRTVVVGNTPNGVQNAGALRAAAREADPTYDLRGNQLYVVTDKFPLAEQGQPPATHQNPLTALGQIARNALYLHQQSQRD